MKHNLHFIRKYNSNLIDESLSHEFRYFWAMKQQHEEKRQDQKSATMKTK